MNKKSDICVESNGCNGSNGLGVLRNYVRRDNDVLRRDSKQEQLQKKQVQEWLEYSSSGIGMKLQEEAFNNEIKLKQRNAIRSSMSKDISNNNDDDNNNDEDDKDSSNDNSNNAGSGLRVAAKRRPGRKKKIVSFAEMESPIIVNFSKNKLKVSMNASYMQMKSLVLWMMRFIVVYLLMMKAE